jgi:hypothetical protein
MSNSGSVFWFGTLIVKPVKEHKAGSPWNGWEAAVLFENIVQSDDQGAILS